MKKLDRLIIRNFIGPFFVTFFITLVIFIMQFLWKYIDDLVGKGLDMVTVFKLLTYMSATFVPLVLPLAILLSSIMTFGNLGESFELVALKSAGISLVRFMRPVFILCIFISGLAFLFSNYAIPWANLHAYSLLYDIRSLKHGFNIKQGVFFNQLSGYAIMVGKKDPDGVTIHQVVIYDRSSGMEDKLILANSGKMEESSNKKLVIFHLFNGWEYSERGERASLDNEFTRVHFNEFQKVLDLSSFAFSVTPISLFASSYQMMDLKQLNKAIDSINREIPVIGQKVHREVSTHYAFYPWKDTGWAAAKIPFTGHPKDFLSTIPDSMLGYVLDRVNISLQESERDNIVPEVQNYHDILHQLQAHQVEWHRKFTLSFACMVLFLIGAPLGSIIRKGGLGTPLVFAVSFFVVYNVISTIGEQLAKNGVTQAWFGMWLSTLVLVPIASFLVYKALNDSQLFNKEFYFRLGRSFRKFLGRYKKSRRPVV